MKFTKYFLAITLLLSSSAFSEKRAEPGFRKLSEKEQIEIKEIQKNLFHKTKKQSLPNYVAIPDVSDNDLPPLIFSSADHNITGVSTLGDYVTIEDDSRWSFKSSDAEEIFSWREKDPIIIVLNKSFISSYFYGFKYKMINARTKKAVDTMITLGPILNNQFTLTILDMNPYNFEIILSDNSVWQCDSSQYYLFDKWVPGDAIIVGTNIKELFNSSYENLLINVNMLQEIKSNQVR